MYSQVPPVFNGLKRYFTYSFVKCPGSVSPDTKNCNEDDSSEEADREPAPDTRDRTSNLFEDGSNLLND